MSKIEELVGLEYAPYSFEVEKGKVREFAEAIGDDNKIYFDSEEAMKEGFEGIPIPLTFLQVIDMWGGYSFQEKMDVLKLNPVKILHGEQEYEHLEPIYAGDTLTVKAKVIKAVTKHGGSGSMDLITTEHSYINQNGTVVAKAKNTLVHRH